MPTMSELLAMASRVQGTGRGDLVPIPSIESDRRKAQAVLGVQEPNIVTPTMVDAARIAVGKSVPKGSMEPSPTVVAAMEVATFAGVSIGVLKGYGTVPTPYQVKQVQGRMNSAPVTLTKGPTKLELAKYREKVNAIDPRGKQSACLFFKSAGIGGYEQRGAQTVTSVDFDMILDEDHALHSNVCAHPVQTGVAITDHVQPQVRTGKVKVLFTNWSLQRTGTRHDPKHAQKQWQSLKELYENGAIVTFTTGLEVYPDVVISSATTSRSDKDGESLTVELAFTQVRQVRLQVLTITGVTSNGQPPKNMTVAANRRAAMQTAAPQVNASKESDSNFSTEGGA